LNENKTPFRQKVLRYNQKNILLSSGQLTFQTVICYLSVKEKGQ